jgi:hypothetical protein
MTNTSVFGSNGVGTLGRIGRLGIGPSAVAPTFVAPNLSQSSAASRVNYAGLATMFLAVGASAGVGAAIGGKRHRIAGVVSGGIVGGLAFWAYMIGKTAAGMT